VTVTQVQCLFAAKQMEEHFQILCREILTTFGGDESLVLMGIRTRGYTIAQRLVAILGGNLHREIPLGALDISLYRDDLYETMGCPIVRSSEIPFSLKGRSVVLVDDVVFTGRTIRAALDALLDHGRPGRVWLAALVDRGGRELPIQPDFMGIKLDIPRSHRVSVKVREIDGEDSVVLEKPA